MFWPYSPFYVTLRMQPPGEAPRYLMFPNEVIHSSWVELALYLGNDFNPEWMETNDASMHAEYHTCGGADAFYHTSQRYLYHLNSYFIEGWKRPGYGFLFDALSRFVKPTVLDYGCGIGADGLWLLDSNVHVNFAELDNPCRAYLRWRLDHRAGMQNVHLYDIETDAIPRHDVIWCMDVLEHIPSAQHTAFLDRLTSLGRVVICNFVDDRTADGTVHHPVDIDELTAHLETSCAVVWKDAYQKPDGGKVRFLMYAQREDG